MTSTIFISHKTEDKERAVRILEFLRDSEYPNERLFLDSDARSGLMVGKKWQEGLYDNLQNCACLIVVGTAKWAASRWCFAEAFIAKNRDIPIVVLKFEEQADLSFLSEYQAVQGFTTSPENLSRLLEILSQLQLAPPGADEERSAGWTRENPELNAQAQRELLEQVSQQVSQLQPDTITRRLVVGAMALMLILLASTTYIFFGEAIAKWWSPAELLDYTPEKFIEAVKDRDQRGDVVHKKFKLIGVPTDNYSASRPRIALDPIVFINIDSMSHGAHIPETLPRHELEFLGVVDSIHPIKDKGKLAEVIVYLVDVQLPTTE